MVASDESVARTLKFTGKSSTSRFLLVLMIPLDEWIMKYPVFLKRNQPEMILVMILSAETEDMNPPVKSKHYLYE